MTAQLDFDGLLAAVAANPHPLADHDRQRIRNAIIVDATTHGDVVDPNRVRRLLTDPATGRLTVNPRRLAATYRVMCVEGLIARVGYVDSDDTAGRNVGARIGLYRWVGGAA